MKRVISLVMSIVMMVSAVLCVDLSAFASELPVYKVLNNGTAEITAYYGSETDLIIPSEIDGYTVTSIGKYAFKNCTSLTSVTIPNSVTSIGDWAFYWCTSLKSVTIPNSVTRIGDCAFLNCENFNSITIPDSVKSIGDKAFYECTSLTSVTISNSVTNIGYGTFEECKSLLSITIPNSVTSIGDEAFYWCESLTSVTIPDSVTNIGEAAFYCCKSLTSVTIPNSVTSIGDGAFQNCESLTSVTIPDSVKSIGDRTFEFCESLTSVTIPNSVTSIGHDAFWCCTSLTSVTIPNSVTSIGRDAFCACASLTSITIPDSVTSIGDHAFNSCISLTSVTIPNSVTSIGDDAFYRCESLTSMYINSIESLCNIEFGSRYSNPLYYAENLYLNNGLVTDLIIPNSVTIIGSCAFINCKNLTSVTIPDSVTSIGGSAFDGCSSLTSITIPDSITSIGGSTFSGCESLTSITIPNSVTYIGDWAFRGCSSLTSVTIPDSVTYIGDWAFYRCTSLTSITIPDGITSIGGSTFSDCESLTSITIPDSVTSIGSYAFSSCESLTSITIPDSVTSIGARAFSICKSLTSITIPDSVTTIGTGAFMGTSLKSVTIPNGVSTIENSVFQSCLSLTSVKIPNSVTSIGEHAFYACKSLTSLKIPKSVTSIGEYAFYNCTSLTSVKIPNSVTSIGEYAFNCCISLTSVTIPNSVTSIGDSAFYLVNNIVFNGSASGYAWGAKAKNGYVDGYLVYKDSTKKELLGCSAQAKNITIPNSVTSIGDDAFYKCTSLTSVIIGNSVTSIGEGAFEYCENLTSVTIPDSVTSIGYAAFYCCESLRDVYYSGTEEEWNSISIDSYYSYNYDLTNANIHFNTKILYTTYGYMYDDEFNDTKISMPEFGTTYSADKSSCIPGIESTVTVRDNKDYCCCNHMISQGVTTVNYAGAKYLLVSAYCGEKEKVNGKEKSIHNSVIYIVREYNNGTRSLVYTVVLDSKSHVGGLAYDGQRVWIANTTSLKAVNMSDIVAKINNGKGYGLIKYASFGKDSNGKNIYTYSLPHKASFLTYFKDMLFVGEYKEIGDALESSPYVYGYSIGQSNGNVKLDLKYKWHIPAMCQGVAFAEHKGSTYGFLSFGYGPVLPSNLRMSMVYFNSNAKSIVELGHINMSYPTMLEDLSVDGKYLYSAYESAANCYHKEKKCQGMNTILISDRITANNINGLVALFAAKKTMGSILPFSMSEENQAESESVAEFQLGDSITATLYDNGELYINGYGLFYDDITDNTLFSDEEFASMVTGLFIDGGITSLPKGVFRNFANLETVQIGLFDNDLTIEPDVFNDCQQLSYLKIGNEYGDAIESVTVSSGAFVGCNSLTDFEIRTSNVTIENGAFDDAGAISFISNQPIPGYTEHQHTFEPLMSDDADCCTYYTVMYACDCGYYYYDYDNQTLGNHDFVDGTCTVCGAVDEDTLPVCQHEFTTYNSVGDSTCTEDGTEIAYCDICNEATDVRVELGSAGHHYTMGEERIVTPPTCADAGKFEYTCDICGEDTNGVIEPTGEHNYIDTITTETCTEKGYTTHTCSICNDTYVDSYVDCASHAPATAVKENVKNATCTAAGSYDEVVYCSVCKHELSRTKKTVAKKPHTYKSYVTTPATTSSAGKITTKCSVCGVVKSTQTVSRISSVKLSGTSYIYDGNVKTPSVTIKNVNGKTLVKGTDYTVSYASGCKYVGKYKVTVRFKGKYSGTKTLYFTIKPMSTSIKSLSACSRGFYVKWYKCTTQTTGYQVQYSTSGKFTSPKTITISKTGTTSKTVKKLKAKKRYYVRVRTYKTVNGTRYYSSWSNAKHITTKR